MDEDAYIKYCMKETPDEWMIVSYKMNHFHKEEYTMLVL